MFKKFFDAVMARWTERSIDVVNRHAQGGQPIDGNGHLHDLVVAQQAQIEALQRFAHAVESFFYENSVIGVNNEFWGNKLRDAMEIQMPFGATDIKDVPMAESNAEKDNEFVMVHKNSLDQVVALLPSDWAPRVRDAIAVLVRPMPYTVAEFKANCEAEGYVTVKKAGVQRLLATAWSEEHTVQEMYQKFDKLVIDVKG